MSTDFVTDTHGLIWYLEDSPRLGVQALAAFDACDRGDCLIYIPTICLVEIIYLQEKGRIASHLFDQLRSDLAAGDTGFVLADLTLEITDLVIHCCIRWPKEKINAQNPDPGHPSHHNDRRRPADEHRLLGRRAGNAVCL